MRVAVATWDWPCFAPGGVGTLSRVLARGLALAGAEVEVWTRGGGARDGLLAGEAEPFAILGLRGRSWRRRGMAHWARGLPVEVSRFRPDAVVASSWEVIGGLPGPDLPRLAVFAHGRDVTADLPAERGALRARVLRWDLRWLCLTRWMQAELAARGVPTSRVRRVPAAVDDPGVPPPRPVRDACTALCVGRLIPRKGQDVAIEAVGRLGGTVRLVIVGEGPDRRRLERIAGPHVSFAGRLDASAIEGAWEQADVFVMPARTEPGGDTEGYGLVFLEAGARGLPVVGARCAGVAEAIDDGRTGLLVEDPRDSSTLASALARLASDVGLRRSLGEGGRRAFELRGRPVHLARAVLEALR